VLGVYHGATPVLSAARSFFLQGANRDDFVKRETRMMIINGMAPAGRLFISPGLPVTCRRSTWKKLKDRTAPCSFSRYAIFLLDNYF